MIQYVMMTHYSPETVLPINVLEIGYGDVPAVAEGSLFKDPSVNYIGIELPRIFDGSFRRYKRFGAHAVDFTEVEGSMAMLPFKDEAFDYVLMRSVYGQFSSRPEIIEPVRYGMTEVSRVLKTDGQVVIAEENTPQSRQYIECELRSAGFVLDGHHNMPSRWENTPEDDEWRVTRSKFYNGQPLEDTPWTSITMAHKPAGLETKPETIPMYTDFYIPDRNDYERKVTDLTFQFPVRK